MPSFGASFLLTCDQGGCNVKVDDMKNSKMHIAVTYGGGIRYICKSDKFNFETHIKRYLVRHENRCKHSETLNIKQPQHKENQLWVVDLLLVEEPILANTPIFLFLSVDNLSCLFLSF